MAVGRVFRGSVLSNVHRSMAAAYTRRKRQERTIMEAKEHGLVKRLRVKKKNKERIGKINHVLEERLKSLSIENQIWRDLAQTNEATANNLRTNLEQVLAQVKDLRSVPGVGLERRRAIELLVKKRLG